MFPELFRLPVLGWPINSYGFSIMVGFLLASYIAVRRGKPLGFDNDFILDVGIIGMIFGIIGAKINYVLQYGQDLAEAGKLSIWGDAGLHPLGVLLLGPVPFAFWLWRVKKAGQNVKLLSWQNGVLLALTLVFAFVGARALFLYENRADYSWRVIRNWQSGFVLYGGLIAGIAAGALYVKMRGRSVGQVADLAAAPMMLALAFGRLGCFLNGCCFGGRGDAFTCITFPEGSPVARELRQKGLENGPVHPTQLYEAAAAVAFFFILSALWKKPRRVDGSLFFVMAILYGAWRFLIEFVRADDRPLWLGPLSYSQVVSLAAVLASGVVLVLFSTRPPRPVEPPAVPPTDEAPKTA